MLLCVDPRGANDFADSQKIPRPPAKPTATTETSVPIAATGGAIPLNQEATLVRRIVENKRRTKEIFASVGGQPRHPFQ